MSSSKVMRLQPCLIAKVSADRVVMPAPLVALWFHQTAFPDQVQASLLHSLRSRQTNQKFLYQSVKQAQRWLAVHRAFSPYCTDANVAGIYAQSIASIASHFRSSPVHLIGLACGDGTKDTAFLHQLTRTATDIAYTPVDSSAPLLLMAHQSACRHLPAAAVFPLVCDIGIVDNLSELLQLQSSPHARRLVTLFNVIHNLEPLETLAKVATILRAGDLALVSANLAPGTHYSQGVRAILPLYDNEPTREWLMTFLLDLGVEPLDGELHIRIERNPKLGLDRVVADFTFHRVCHLNVDADQIVFRPGDSIRLFFSYRFTPAKFASLVEACGLRLVDQRIAPSEQEGVFLIRAGVASRGVLRSTTG